MTPRGMAKRGPGRPWKALDQPRHPDAQWLDDLVGQVRMRLRGKKLTQTVLAGRLGISEAYLSRILNGSRPAPPELIGRLAALAGLKLTTIDARAGTALAPEVTKPYRKPVPQPAATLVASYTSWRDVPDCPCKVVGSFPDRHPHVWQIQTRDPACTIHKARGVAS